MPKIQPNLQALEPYEQAAILMATLAYPEHILDNKQMGKIQISMCHSFLREMSSIDPDWARQPQKIKPIYAFSTINPHKLLRTLERKMRDRMLAAKIAIAFLQEIELGKAPELPDGVKWLSLNEVTAIIGPDLVQDNPDKIPNLENVEQRIWRPSLPVIHLAVAVQKMLTIAARPEHDLLTYRHFFFSPRLVREAFSLAEGLISDLTRITRFKVDNDKLIRIVPLN